MVGNASHKSIREAVAAAMRGESSMLEGSAEMPLAKAERFAQVLVSEDTEARVRVRTFTRGPWLHIVPEDAAAQVRPTD